MSQGRGNIISGKKGGVKNIVAHLQNPPPLTNIEVTPVAFYYVWGCNIYYIQPN